MMIRRHRGKRSIAGTRVFPSLDTWDLSDHTSESKKLMTLLKNACTKLFHRVPREDTPTVRGRRRPTMQDRTGPGGPGPSGAGGGAARAVSMYLLRVCL